MVGSRDGRTGIGPPRPDDGETIAQTSASAVDQPTIVSESVERAAWIASGPSPSVMATLQETGGFDPPGRPHLPSSVLADLQSTMDGAGTLLPETIAEGIPTCDAATLQATGVFTPEGRPSAHTSRSVANPLETVAETSGATTDFSAGGPPRNGRNTAGSFVAPSARRRPGPAEYEILGELGRGGMGVVYKALDHRLNRLVALKMIRGRVGEDADDIQLARFKIEAEAVAALRHPNILQIYEIGESDGSPYVALELLEGGSLADRLRKTLMPPKQAAQWLVPLVMAMDAAHRAGIVHRDLKAANILFSADGIPKITDFGLAKRLEMDEGQTQTGQILGTPS